MANNHIAVLGPHPLAPSRFEDWLKVEDTHTAHGVCLRSLVLVEDKRSAALTHIADCLIKHHISESRKKVVAKEQKILTARGLLELAKARAPFPKADATKKGNLAEVLLAEYICESASAVLPIYRLRFNPNIDQSMKGDDVLAFCFDADPFRIVVGEAKFRTTPSAKVVRDIVSCLEQSYDFKVPISLDFISETLRIAGNEDLANKIDECYLKCIEDAITPSYIGMLMSNQESDAYVKTHGDTSLERGLLISYGLEDPSSFVAEAWALIEQGL